jgi:hypothetical protein
MEAIFQLNKIWTLVHSKCDLWIGSILFIYLWFMKWRFKRRTQIKGVWEKEAEENIVIIHHKKTLRDCLCKYTGHNLISSETKMTRISQF